MLPTKHDRDKELLLLISKGDEQAFSEFFYRYHQLLGAFVFRIIASRQLTEEIVQDVFIKIWNKKEALAEVSNIKAWLFIIAKNHTLNCIRLLVEERLDHGLCDLNDVADQDLHELDDKLITEERFKLIHEAVDQLPPQQQKVFILSRFQRLKYNEIARELNISRETVKSYLRIAHASITKFVSNRMPRFLWLIVFCL